MPLQSRIPLFRFALALQICTLHLGLYLGYGGYLAVFQCINGVDTCDLSESLRLAVCFANTTTTLLFNLTTSILISCLTLTQTLRHPGPIWSKFIGLRGCRKVPSRGQERCGGRGDGAHGPPPRRQARASHGGLFGSPRRRLGPGATGISRATGKIGL